MSSQSLLEKCCLIGQPVAENPTHFMIEQAIRQDELDLRFLTFEVAPESLADAIRGIRALGFRGTKIAEPHHVPVMQLLDESTELAHLAGSVNSIRREGGRLVGDNTIGPAVVNLLSTEVDLTGATVIVWGAGRVAQSAAAALALAGAGSLEIIDRDAQRAQQVAERLSAHTSTRFTAAQWPENPLTIPPEVAVVVQATSLGSRKPDAPLPIVWDSLQPEVGVVDVCYDPPATWFLQEATNRDCHTVDGLSVLVEQTALALKSWSGVDADRQAMREAAEEFLAI